MLNELQLFYLLGKSTLSKADKQLADVESTVACRGSNCPCCPNIAEAARGNRLPFLPELHLKMCALFTEIGI
jgi:hypothetical protein